MADQIPSTQTSDGLTKRTLTYNELGKVTKISDAVGGQWNFTYQGVDLVSASDSVGPLMTLAYDDSLNPHSPTAYCDGAGNTWTMAYNQYGQILSVTPPADSPTGSLIYSYDEDPDSSTLGYLKQILALRRNPTTGPKG